MAQRRVGGPADVLESHVQPALTTVRVPAEDMWRAAVDRLAAAMAGEAAPSAAQIQVALVVRESSGPAPAARSRTRPGAGAGRG